MRKPVFYINKQFLNKLKHFLKIYITVHNNSANLIVHEAFSSFSVFCALLSMLSKYFLSVDCFMNSSWNFCAAYLGSVYGSQEMNIWNRLTE